MSEHVIIELLDRAAGQVSDSEPPVPALLRDARRALRRRRSALVAGSVVAVLGVVGTTLAVGRLEQGRSHPAPAAALPAPPAGMKWSGIGRQVVAVPESWPMWPGLYCGSPDGHEYVTIVEAGINVSCVPIEWPNDLIVLTDHQGRLATPVDSGRRPGTPAASQLERTRTTLPDGWTAVPARIPAQGVGPPTAEQEARALTAAGFRVERAQEPYWGVGPRVRTVPEIGAPARLGSTVVVYDRRPVSAQAILAGRLLWVGGPAPGSPRPHEGVVHVVGGGIDKFIRVQGDGRWSFRGPVGTFTVTGSSPGYLSAEGVPDACRADRPVRLRYSRTTHADVYCQLR